MFNKKGLKSIFVVGFAVTCILATAGLGLAATQTINCISAWPKTAFETSNLLRYIEMVQKKLIKSTLVSCRSSSRAARK